MGVLGLGYCGMQDRLREWMFCRAVGPGSSHGLLDLAQYLVLEQKT